MDGLRAALALIFLAAGAVDLRAAAYDPKEPRRMKLVLVYIDDGGKTEFMLTIGQSGFKTVASLEKYLTTVAPGSTLEWSPGCMHLNGEPLSDEKEIKELKMFAAKHGIKFVIHPAG